MRQLLLLVLLVLFGENVLPTMADYHVGLIIQSFSNPNNTLYDNSCCNGNTTCVDGTCRPTLRLCFRDSNHRHSDIESSCDDLVKRGNAGFHAQIGEDSPPFQQYYPGSFQIYTRVSHNTGTTPDFDPPFTDPLIDNIFIEVSVPAIPHGDKVKSETFSVTGDFSKATLNMAVNVQCARNYFGAACEQLCDPDGTNCRTVYFSYSGYRIPVPDTIVVALVILLTLGVVTGIIGDHVLRRNRGTSKH